MPPRTIYFKGQPITVPDTATDEQVANIIKARSTGKKPVGYSAKPMPEEAMGIAPPKIEQAGAKPPIPPSPVGMRGMSVTERTGKAVLDGIMDPTAVGATGGGVLGTMLAGPPGGYAGAVLGGAGGALYKDAKAAYTAGKMPNVNHMGERALEGAVSGAMGEGLGQLIPKVPLRRTMDPTGTLVKDFMGKDVAANQLTDSAPLNFMNNMAKYGMGGQRIMKNLEERQSFKAIHSLERTAENIAPPPPGQAAGTFWTPPRGKINYQLDDAGKSVQNALGSELDTHMGTMENEYGGWLKKYGGLQEVDQETGEALGPSVRELHKIRSESLKAARQAHASGDGMAQANALNSAEAAQMKMEKLTQGSKAMTEYRTLADTHKEAMGRLDNPMAFDLRERTKADDVIHKVLGNELKTYAPLGENVALSNQELLGKLKSALPPDKYEQLKADSLYTVVQDAINPETGILDHAKLHESVRSLDGDIRTELFGKNGDAQLTKIMTILGRTQEKRGVGGETGRLFMAIRGPAAAMAVGGGVASALVGGAASTGVMVSGGAILLAPYVFAKMLTTDAGRAMLIRTASTRGPAQRAAVQALQRFVTNNITQHTTHAIGNRMGIPEPPE